MSFYRRRSGLAAAFGLLTLSGLVSAAAPVCRAAEISGKTVSIDVASGDLHAVVSMLERQANVEAMVRDGSEPFKPVYVHLDGASLPKALRTIALSAGAKVHKNDDGVYVFEPETASDTGDHAAQLIDAAPAAQPAEAPAAPRLPAASLHWQRLVLKHTVPHEILRIMHWDQDVVMPEPFKPPQPPSHGPNVMSPQAQLLNNYLNSPNTGYGNVFNNAGERSGDVSVPLGAGNGGPAAANYSEHRSPEAGSNSQANQFPGFPGGGGFPGAGGGFPGGFTPGGGNPFQPQAFQPGGGGNGQPGRGAALPDGVDKIYALDGTNTLLIHSTPEAFNAIKQVLNLIDVAPRQVEIKVEFVTASVADVDNLGVNFDLVPYPGLELATSQGSGLYGGTANGIGPTFLQYATGNIVAQLFQTLVRTRGKVVQAPMITTTNNVQATIQITTEIPYSVTSAVPNGGLSGGTTTITNPNFLQVSTYLTITPRINSDDSVTMNLAPQISDVSGQPSLAGGPPPTITQNVTTLRTVQSGETMVLGGLVRKQESSSTQRIPIISDIPILGGLFRTRNKQVNDQELLIFVTPTIIGESNAGPSAGATSSTVTP